MRFTQEVETWKPHGLGVHRIEAHSLTASTSILALVKDKFLHKNAIDEEKWHHQVATE